MHIHNYVHLQDYVCWIIYISTERMCMRFLNISDYIPLVDLEKKRC